MLSLVRGSRWWLFVLEQKLVVAAGAAAIGFLAAGRVALERVPRVVDWTLLLVLFALILGVELIRESNLLDRAAAWWMGRFGAPRSFAAGSVLFAGLLAALVTNDVALFVVVPLTVAAARASGFDAAPTVMLQIVAVNLLGCLTPLGNPQNLFLAHESGLDATRFVAVMAPFVAWNAVGFGVAVPLLERQRARARTPAAVARLRFPPLFAGTLVFSLVVLEILDALPAWPCAAAAAIASLLLIRDRVGEIDFFILPLFFFAFIVVEGLRSFDVYRLFEIFPREPDGLALWVTALLGSQIISNVPAAVLLEPLAGERWRLLLWAVNAGGCGTMIASMANLIGWRLYVREHGADPSFFDRFAVVQLAFLAWTGVGGWFLLRLVG
ncbi:MAG: SLC13 family permease [Thermoanaerobaculia bacterium]